MQSDPDAVTLSTVAIFSSHREGNMDDRIRNSIATLRGKGANFFRMTRVDGGVWIEGWPEHPVNQGEFTLRHAERIRIPPVVLGEEM